MTTKQKIQKAKNVFAWVNIHDQDGEYIQVTKTHILFVCRNLGWKVSQDKFQLREDGDLYVN